MWPAQFGGKLLLAETETLTVFDETRRRPRRNIGTSQDGDVETETTTLHRRCFYFWLPVTRSIYWLSSREHTTVQMSLLHCIHAVLFLTGFYSWRRTTGPVIGSWFIQALHKMMEKYGSRLDFLTLLTRVNHEVARFHSSSSQAYMNCKKQVPSVVSMLTKDIYFTPKPK